VLSSILLSCFLTPIVDVNTMSCRERLNSSTYRRRSSFPKSNRSSLHLGSTYSSGYSSSFGSSCSTTFSSKRNSLHDNSYVRPNYNFSQTFDNQYDSETEDINDRIDKLLKRTESFEARIENMHKSTYDSKLGISELYNSSRNDDSAEFEWKRLLDAGILIDRAVELVRLRYRVPKAKFEYSPEGPSPRAYDFPSDTVLVTPPYDSSDDEDQRKGATSSFRRTRKL